VDPLADLQALTRAPLDVARDLKAIADALRVLPEIEQALRPLPKIVDTAERLPELQDALHSLPTIIEALHRLPAIEDLIVSLAAALQPALTDVHELRGIVGSQQQQVTHIEEMMQRLDRRTVVLERAVTDLQHKADRAMHLLPDPDDDTRTVLEKAKDAIAGT
jgi:chromosome segregation ATPase